MTRGSSPGVHGLSVLIGSGDIHGVQLLGSFDEEFVVGCHGDNAVVLGI